MDSRNSKHYLKNRYTKCTKTHIKICEVCAHLCGEPWYYNTRKNPPIHYILFLLYPIVKIPSPKKDSRSKGCLFLCAPRGEEVNASHTARARKCATGAHLMHTLDIDRYPEHVYDGFMKTYPRRRMSLGWRR